MDMLGFGSASVDTCRQSVNLDRASTLLEISQASIFSLSGPAHLVLKVVTPSCLPCHSWRWRPKPSYSGCGMRGIIPILRTILPG